MRFPAGRSSTRPKDPGWAISLANLLLRSRDATSLLNGRALLGHVDRYMRRAGVDPDAIDILALFAALGEVTDAELPRLAAQAAVRRSTVASALTAATHSGLIDVQQRRDDQGDPARVYSVRPPMLADVLVAERAFDAPAPLSADLRYALAAALLRWESAAPRSPEREQVAADVLHALLALRLRSAE